MNSESPDSLLTRKIAAITETTGVPVVALVLAAILISLVGIDSTAILPSGPNPDYLGASVNLLAVLLLQYSPVFALAYLIGRWHRGRAVREYGLTRNSTPLRSLIVFGILAFAVADFPAKIMKWAQAYLPLGPIPETQSILENADWFSWGFWLYMAIGSFLVIPIIEEIFFRGYIQTRLEEDFGGPAAVLISSAIFAFGHVQYLYLGIFGIGNTISVFIAALGFGFLYFKTRSLIPSIIMHAIANLPLIEPGVSVSLVLMFILVIMYREKILRQLRNFSSAIQSIPEKWTVAVFMVYGAVFISLLGFGVGLVSIIGLVSFPIALYLEFRERRALNSPD